jgi:hypothetical protein
LIARGTTHSSLGACLILSALSGCRAGSVSSPSLGESRTPIHMTLAVRAHLRHGMRTYLESTQGIIDGLAGNRMTMVADHARRAGTGAFDGVPLWSAATLPPAFVLLGIDTHQKFDALSVAAATGSKREILLQLQEILANCTACHNSYRISPEQR